MIAIELCKLYNAEEKFSEFLASLGRRLENLQSARLKLEEEDLEITIKESQAALQGHLLMIESYKNQATFRTLKYDTEESAIDTRARSDLDITTSDVNMETITTECVLQSIR